MLSPLSWLSDRGHDISKLQEGDDVTEQIGVTKYISEEERDQYFPAGPDGDGTRSGFPIEVPKSDEKRLQDNPQFLKYIKDRSIIITRKEDGCSATFVHKDGLFSVCGRNFTYHVPTGTSRHYFLIASKFNLEGKMREMGINVAIQGEIVGPRVNGNRLRLEEYQFRVFNIFSFETHQYLHWEEVQRICDELCIDTVPVVFQGNSSELELSMSNFIAIADSQQYARNVLAEGIVVKTNDDGLRSSFKVISNNYLLKHKL